eukprot:jgi/Botrbrau1/13546/Bobra.4_2s0004.1
MRRGGVEDGAHLVLAQLWSLDSRAEKFGSDQVQANRAPSVDPDQDGVSQQKRRKVDPPCHFAEFANCRTSVFKGPRSSRGPFFSDLIP